MKEKEKKESQEMTTHFESIAEKVRASDVPSVEGEKEKNEGKERHGRRSNEGQEKLEHKSNADRARNANTVADKEAEENERGFPKDPREKPMGRKDGSGGEGTTGISLKEISKYRQAAQQFSMETIRAAEERYVKAAKESAGSAAAYVAEKGARAKDNIVEGAQKASELVAEKGRAAKDTALEKGQQGYVAAKDTLAGAAGKKPGVDQEESEAMKSAQPKGEAGGQGTGEGADSRAVEKAAELTGEEQIFEGALPNVPMELHGGRDQWGGEGGLLQAIGETLVEIAQNTRDLIIGPDPSEKDQKGTSL